MWAFFFLLAVFQRAASLAFHSAEIPSTAYVGRDVVMRCLYDMENDQLYMVKWYFNDVEFYRYTPGNEPVKQSFSHARGLVLDLEKSDNETVYLRQIKLEHSGNYICEVYAEAPTFAVVSASSQMDVREVPSLRLLTIEVPRFIRKEEEEVVLSCTYEIEEGTLLSIKWYRNDEEFYRFAPRAEPPKQFFRVSQFDVDLAKSGNESVYLRHVAPIDAGSFRCEISSDAPSFETVLGEAIMWNLNEISSTSSKTLGTPLLYLLSCLSVFFTKIT